MFEIQGTTPRVFWSLGLIPAQSWIAESRRSRDLLAGSRSLAWLMGRLLGHLKAKGATVRLPELREKDLQSFAGSFSDALIGGSSGISNHASGWVELPLAKAENLFRELEIQLDCFWSELYGEVVEGAKRSAEDLWKIAGPEICDSSCPLQLAWAVQDAVANEKEGLRKADALYVAVKRSRQVPEHAGAPVRKCGQCGRREAMGGENPKKWRDFQARLAACEEVKRGLRFDANEYLCPVCGLRRLAGYLTKKAFPSTSEVAAADWLWRIRKVEDLREALTILRQAARAVPGYEEDWADRAPLFFRRSLDREFRRARDDKDRNAEAALEKVQAALGDLEEGIRKHNRDPKDPIPEKPPEYLAVVMFDGDDMGRKLREDLETLPGKVVEFQNEMATFFGNSDETLGERGKPFYLGGDEGLILAPVASVLELAGKIRQLWKDTAEATAPRPTLSMGIALFDRERPLGAAIEAARRSLDEHAKRLDRKNGLAVTVQTASGSEWTAVAHWGESWDRIAEAVKLIREKTLAAGWPHDVERFLRTLPEQAFREGGETRSAIREEVKRISFRRVSRQELKPAAWTRLKGDDWWEQQPPEEELAALADNFHLVAFLARESGALAPAPLAPSPLPEREASGEGEAL